MDTEDALREIREMNPCPFCEAKGKYCTYMEEYNYSALGDNIFYRVQCAHCGARGPTADSRIDAIAAWNRALTRDGMVDDE